MRLVVRQSDIESLGEQISQQMVLLSQIADHLGPSPATQIRQRISATISANIRSGELVGLRSLFMFANSVKYI